MAQHLDTDPATLHKQEKFAASRPVNMKWPIGYAQALGLPFYALLRHPDDEATAAEIVDGSEADIQASVKALIQSMRRH